jgi:phosphatidylinositol alpha-1,6-mannosyltransferase
MPKSNSPAALLGLFPQFGNGHVGGIQESARVAWRALSSHCPAELICYSRDKAGNGNCATSDSRTRAILEAVRRKATPEQVLIWQIGLLKLLPFLRNKNQTRVVVFLHGIEAWREQDWFIRRLAGRVDLFLTNSEYTWQRFCSVNPLFASTPHKAVPLGLAAAEGLETKPPSEPPAALMLSRLSKTENYKGHREVIEAWPRVLEKQKDAQLWIAGDGDQRRELEELVTSRGLEESILFFGKVTEEEKRKLMEASRCLVMPSRGEGFGLVYLEAMRIGRPCLVSTLDAGREVVNPPEAGLAANPDDSEQLADSLMRLLTDGPEWQQWSRQARARYQSNYTAEHFQRRLLAALFPDGVSSSLSPSPVGRGKERGLNGA